jgi:hypothetical protein
MTPLARILARYLPDWMIAPALAIAYAAMIFSVIVVSDLRQEDIIYVDVRGD